MDRLELELVSSGWSIILGEPSGDGWKRSYLLEEVVIVTESVLWTMVEMRSTARDYSVMESVYWMVSLRKQEPINQENLTKASQ